MNENSFKVELEGFEQMRISGRMTITHRSITGGVKETSCKKPHLGVKYTLVLEAEDILVILQDAARTKAIEVQKIREFGDKAVEDLRGAEIGYSKVKELVTTGRKGKTRVQQLMELFGLSEEDAKLVLSNPQMFKLIKE